jgi:hypothetical protein
LDEQQRFALRGLPALVDYAESMQKAVGVYGREAAWLPGF